MDNVIEKIRKLLALAGSNNDHEARAALLKARELMARHKLTEKDVSAERKAELRKVVCDGYTYSGKKNWWFARLSRVIAENHCCHACGTKYGKSATATITFAGLDDDPDIAAELFRYAVQHIQYKEKDYRLYINRRTPYQAERNARTYSWIMNYANGFSDGLAAQYAEQFKQNENECMALALVRPVEVEQFAQSLNTWKPAVRRAYSDETAQQLGYMAGYKFNPTKQITG